MTRVPVWFGTVAGGKLTLNTDREFRRYIKSLPDQPIQLVVQRKKSQRSLGQNAYLWSVAYPVLAEALGYDAHEVDDLHYALVAKWSGEHFDRRLGAMVPNKRSSTLTTAEMSEYIEWLVRFGATTCGVVVPLPGESA